MSGNLATIFFTKNLTDNLQRVKKGGETWLKNTTELKHHALNADVALFRIFLPRKSEKDSVMFQTLIWSVVNVCSNIKLI